jgi:hypothetical protein
MTFGDPSFNYAAAMYAASEVVTAIALGSDGSFIIGNDPGADPRPHDIQAATPVLRYKSYAQFAYDLAQHAITGPFQWVMYDNEDWPDAHPGELHDPWTYMPLFVTAAHNAGYKVICAPGRDLGNDPQSVNPKQQGETLEAWYVRTGIASAAASAGADILSVQSQADEATGEFATFYGQAAAQAQAVAASLPVWAGLRSNQAGITAQQLLAAANSVGAPGYWLNATLPTVQILVDFLGLWLEQQQESR